MKLTHLWVSNLAIVLLFLAFGGHLPQTALREWKENYAWVALVRSVQENHAPFLDASSTPIESDAIDARWSAVAAYYSGDCQMAATLSAKNISSSPVNPLFYYFIGNLFYECNRIDRAIEYWHEAGTAVYPLRQCAQSLIQNRIAEVLAQCQIALDVDPNSAQAYDYLGQVNSALRRWKEAAESFDKAIALDDSIYGVYLRGCRGVLQCI